MLAVFVWGELLCWHLTAVVNAPAKAGIDLGENGSIYPRPTPSLLR